MAGGRRGAGGAEPSVVLHQFRASHFNEKARWALDWKGIPHRRVTHLPGPHLLGIRRMTGGTQVPVLELDGRFVPGSADILATLDERFPERPLHPADPEQRRRALEIQAHFDANVGPAVRAAHFSHLLPVEPAYMCRIFSGHLGSLGRAVYGAAFPVVRRAMARSTGIEAPGARERAVIEAQAGFDFVARNVNAHGQLVGGEFTVADLTCAALLAPLVNPDHPDMRSPEPLPQALRELLGRWADHEAAAWVREQYARHRPPPADA
jgi:glutathione S-transferase